MIEELTSETIERALPFYYAFRREVAAPYPDLFRPGPEGPAHFLRSWGALLASGIGTILVASDDAGPSGALFATLTPDLFDGAPVATEHAWYVMPEARGGRTGAELLDAYEAWARKRGAARVFLSHFVVGMPDLEGPFARRGFVPLEKHFLKAAR